MSEGGVLAGSTINVSDRYDAFQREAVENVVVDFRAKPNGRYLLVIPTGGGKTTTAVKAVHALFKTGDLQAQADRVMWVVHRDELRRQALGAFESFANKVGAPELAGLVDVLMLSQVKSYLESHPGARFAVIDEAHHVAAKSYQALFDRSSLGILGLTATPSRHDGQPLQFDRESYSIGFPDLVSMGVLLRPNVITVDGGTYDLNDISNDSDDLEALNNEYRNSRILDSIEKNKANLNKLIVYVGTKKHARDLYAKLKDSRLKDSYESFNLILGDERRRWLATSQAEFVDEPREVFIKAQKESNRSILVNVDVLTEGYDDPTVNTIVMARPTNSKLVYMQALGRAVRIDPNNPDKDAYVVEVVDALPNIKYRIDNRWLFSDVADLLEPAVVDVPFGSAEDRLAKIAGIYDQYQVDARHRVLPEWQPRDRVTMLLFKVYISPGVCEHVPLVITNDSRLSATRFFNYLATRMGKIHAFDIEQAIRPVLDEALTFPALHEPETRKLVFQAMENAWVLVTGDRDGKKLPDAIESGRPWVTFVSFRLQLVDSDLGDDLLRFTEDMTNCDPVRAALRSRAYADDFVLVKFPLPLRGSWGVFLPGAEFATLRGAVDELGSHASEHDGAAQWQATVAILGTTTLSVEPRHIQSLATIVRESLDYFRPVRALASAR